MIIRKISKIIENNSLFISDIKNMVNEHQKFKDFLNSMSNFVIDRYVTLSKDNSYSPEYGNKPYKVKRNKINVIDAFVYNGNKTQQGIDFKVEAYDYIYYIFVSYDDIEQVLIKKAADKYNL